MLPRPLKLRYLLIIVLLIVKKAHYPGIVPLFLEFLVDVLGAPGGCLFVEGGVEGGGEGVVFFVDLFVLGVHEVKQFHFTLQTNQWLRHPLHLLHRNPQIKRIILINRPRHAILHHKYSRNLVYFEPFLEEKVFVVFVGRVGAHDGNWSCFWWFLFFVLFFGWGVGPC